MPGRIARRFSRTLWPVAMLLIAVLVVPTAAVAATPYEVRGVEVDVTAADAATARDQAIAEGERKAFQMLLEQLIGADRAAAIREPSASELANMVRDFQVESEKLSPVRYIGVLTYRFAAEPVNAFIGLAPDTAFGAAPAEIVPSGPVRTLSVTVPLPSLRDWIDIRRRLAGIPAVRSTEIRYLARDEARLNLTYAGDPQQLMSALAQRQLVLSQAESDWVLHLSGAAAVTP